MTRPFYAFDLETAPLPGEENNPQAGLKWPVTRITTAALYSPDVSWVLEDTDEQRLIASIAERFSLMPAGDIVTWNGSCFDNPMLLARTKALGMGDWWHDYTRDDTIVPKYEPQPRFSKCGYHLHPEAAGREVHGHIDGAYQYGYQQYAKAHGIKWGLKPVAKAHGIEVIEVDRTKMDELSVAERMAYNLSDVVATYRLAELAANNHDGIAA